MALGVRSFSFVLAFLSWPASGLAQETMSLAVPNAALPAPTTLPPRPLPDLSVAPDMGDAFDRAKALYVHFRDLDPPIDARVLALNLDPMAAFTMLRDQVQSLPYDGHLRDPSSVFAAAGGNSYDKALALADLLGRMGYDTQLVTSDAPSPVVPDMACGGGQVAAEEWELTRLGPEVLARVPLRASASFAMLKDQLSPTDQPQDPSTQPHVWVQMRDGADWIDLDPWLPATHYGDHPQGAGTVLQTPPEAHSVSISVMAETLADGQLSQSEVLSAQLDMPMAAESLVALYFGANAEGAGGGLLKALDSIEGNAGQTAAFLMVNGEIQKGSPFNTPGRVVAAGDGFFAGEENALTTGVLLTVTSHVPGLPDHSETRWVIDLLPPELRLPGARPLVAEDLLTPVAGQNLPAAMEGLRHFMISNGGTPLRFLAGEQAKQIVGFPAVNERTQAGGAPNPYDAIWAAWLEAGRVQLAAETLLRARPSHNGTCAVIARPRVMIWGVAGGGNDQVLHWLDWTIDDIALMGGDARSKAEARLWHGALQAALEKEALMQLILLPDDSVPLDLAPMRPIPADKLAALGLDGAQDGERGYLTLSDGVMAPNLWWRLNPGSGEADARGRFRGNEYGNYTNSTPNTGPRIPIYEDPRLARLEGDAIWREIQRQEARRLALQAAAQPKCGGNEYMILTTCVSIPGSIAVGAIGIAVMYGIYSYYTH